MNYLEQIIQQTQANNRRVKQTRSAIQALVDTVEAQRLAEMQALKPVSRRPADPQVSAVAAAAGGKHSMNDGHGHTSQAEVRGLNKDFEARLQRLIKDSGGRIKVTSGYRSPQRQQQLWNQALKKYGSAARARKWVAPPGRSNHNHGLAADIAGDRAWAHKNAHKYGLVFPMAHEPWHIEPIGARKMRGR